MKNISFSFKFTLWKKEIWSLWQQAWTVISMKGMVLCIAAIPNPDQSDVGFNEFISETQF